MADFAERFDRRGPDATRRAVGAHECREPHLDGTMPLAQGIVVRIGDFRLVLGVVQRIMAGNFNAEAQQFRFGLGLGQGSNGFCVFHAATSQVHAIPATISASDHAAQRSNRQASAASLPFLSRKI